MSTASTYNVGDLVEIGMTFKLNGTLTSPDNAQAVITVPSGTTTTHTDADAEVTIGTNTGGGETQAVTDRLASLLDLETAENTAGTGIVRVRFVATEAGEYDIHIQGWGTVQGAQQTTVAVSRPRATGVTAQNTAIV